MKKGVMNRLKVHMRNVNFGPSLKGCVEGESNDYFSHMNCLCEAVPSVSYSTDFVLSSYFRGLLPHV